MTAPFLLSDARIEAILEAVGHDAPVDETLPDGGRIHVDRRRPFLCVYRRPTARADDGTESLLTSQAAFLLAPGRASRHQALTNLLSGFVELGIDAFGSVLVVEIWAAEAPKEDPDMEPAEPRFPPSIRILAPQKNVPNSTLKALERAILEIEWPIAKPAITVCYGKRQHPEKLPPLLTVKESRDLNAVFLGIEISPFYRNAATGELYPQVLKEFRHALGIALKQAFFTFSHTRATYRPAHYHELGPTTIADAVWETDHRLADLGDSFDLLLQVTPVNARKAWLGFKQHWFDRPPEFAYRPLNVDVTSLKAQLFRIPVREIEDPALHSLMAEKQDELDRQITLLADRGTPRFLLGSLQLFEPPDAELLKLAKTILSRLPPHSRQDRVMDYIGAEAFSEAARSEIEQYRKINMSFSARVEVRDDVPGLLVSNGRLIVGHQVRVARARIEATLQHEVGTHLLTYQNGLSQPFRLMHTGLAHYEELQEALAVFSEYLVGGLTKPRMRTLAGRVLAVASIADGADFIETFRRLHDDFGFSQRAAYTIAMRVYRGGGYTKDVVYLRGLVRLLDHLASGASLEDLLIGKIALHNSGIAEELTWRTILRPAPHKPRYLDDADAQARLERVRTGLSVLDLMGVKGK